MYKARRAMFCLTLLVVAVFGISGCTFIFQKGRRKDVEKISALQNEYSRLQQELSDMERARNELERRLRDEQDVNVSMRDGNLVITFVAEVLFDSGKADLRSESFDRLAKVARVLSTSVPGLEIGVHGHTDNVPIRHSGWKSNWELSAARAMSVVRYLVEDQGIDPHRISGTGFGEYRPVDSNDTAQGRQKNRRVEIVVFPEVEKKVGVVPGENLK